jgi:hypothetical protein
MSTFGPLIKRSVTAGAAFAQWEPVKTTTEGTDGQELTVIKSSATSSIIIGVALDAAVSAGDGVEIALPGSIVLMRVGSGGVTKDDYVGIDGSDATEIATLTLSGSGTTNRQVLGIALRTGAENALIPVLFNPFITQT